MANQFKKREWPRVGQDDTLIDRCGVTADTSLYVEKKQAKTKTRRSKHKKNENELLTIMYTNVQGFTGKKTCLQYIMDEVGADVVMLAETMTKKPVLEGCQSICPSKSVGQNIAIILANKTCSYKKMKLYDPNETVNMIGIRLEVGDMGIRLYTAHLKQQSTNSREEIAYQFDEIKNQFHSANMGREGMLMIFDSNVHVGTEGVGACKDIQDAGGKMLMSIVKEEGLTVVNNLALCEGVVTRVDPRNGTKSTIDLAICNTYMIDKLDKMSIDEKGEWKPKKYGKKVTSTDHNTILVTMKIRPVSVHDSCSNHKRYNLRNEEARQRMQEIVGGDPSLDNLFVHSSCNINDEMTLFMSKWEGFIKQAFNEVKQGKNQIRGVNHEVKELLKEEKWIRRSVTDNVEKGRRIFEVQKLISDKIAANLMCETEAKVMEIVQSDNPQSKVFSIRRNFKKNNIVDFPLKDKNGVLQVSKAGIDQVISQHFCKVFSQNPVSGDKVWQDYWTVVDEIFDIIDDRTLHMYDANKEPSEEEIDSILKCMDSKKSNYGSLSIDLAKLCGRKISSLIYRCILMCFQKNVIPNLFREHKMTLLLKNKGVINEIDDYRGIFLRHLILSVYQKWLYQRNRDVVDESGSEFACGGRTERSGIEALLIVKLIQDYVRWTGKDVVMKFLDVEKFFDTMNYKLAMIEAYRNGVDGRFWQSYKNINSKLRCIPHIPSGKCSPIDVENLFVQGSCDAVLVAWPLMDADNKKQSDCFSSDFCIEGITVNRLSFVDDLLGLNASIEIANDSSIRSEVFEKKTRLHFKVPKCKVMSMNCKKQTGLVFLNGQEMEQVKEHVYLGTIISANGERFAEMKSRMSKTNSVSNEIEQICKTTELSNIRLRYVKVLMTPCLDMKLKYGCALWNVTKYKNMQAKLNGIKPNLLKRVLQLPKATPSTAVQYEFGINDLTLDILMEKVILAVQTLKADENRISRRILEVMLKKKVPGFCSEVIEACNIIGVSIDELLATKKDVRQVLKRKITEIQSGELLKRMALSSKMDRVVTSGYKFNGGMMKYLSELNFWQARAIFMARYRMWPTKDNFPGRWKGTNCNSCGYRDTDEHILLCPGYADIVDGKFGFGVFWDEEVLKDAEKLKNIADTVVVLIERMEHIQSLDLD